jgi:hypothetical protein
MSIRHAYSVIAAGLLACSVVTFGHAREATAAGILGSDKKNRTPVTLVGCIQREKDYRAQHNSGRGQFGLGNEYVLLDARPGPVDDQTQAEADCTNLGNGRAYELKGNMESRLEPFVNQRIEITGMLEPAKSRLEVGTSGNVDAVRPTGGPWNPQGYDLKLFEVRVHSFREIPIRPEPPQVSIAVPALPPPAPAPAPPEVREEVAIVEETPAVPAQLPKTASPLALTGLLGLLSLGGAFGLRTWRRQ